MSSPGDDDAGAATQHVLSLSAAFMVSAALHAAASLEVASHLQSGPRSADELATACGADADALHRVLTLLAAHGVFRRAAQPRSFELNAAARALLPGVTGSAHAAVRWLADEFHFNVFGQGFLHSMRTGQPAVAPVCGAPIFEHLAANAALSRTFHAAMDEFSGAVAHGVLAAYDFTGIDVIADVGGGHGAVLAAVLRAHPAMRGVLFDLPQVASGARAVLERAAVADRTTVVSGDFFAPGQVPAGADAYILKHIIHDWDDDRAAAILRAVRGAMQRPTNRVLLLERVAPADDAAAPESEAQRFCHIMDMEMLVVAGGRERSAAQFEALLRAAGLRLCRIVPTHTQLSVIEAQPEEEAV